MSTEGIVFIATIWAVIPLAAILMKGFREAARSRAAQQALGTSTHELERRVAEMQKANTLLADRVENLEAIVVTQTWDAVNLPLSSNGERDLRIASAAHREVLPPTPDEVAQANQQRVQQVAQRLGR